MEKNIKTYVQLFENWLIYEGGWASTKTQDTVIKPKLIADAVKKLAIIGKDFSVHAKGSDLPPLEFIKPIGSGTWYEDDIKSQPDKVYGDVDFMVSYPTLDLGGKTERENEILSAKLYNAEMMVLLKSKKYSFIDIGESESSSSPTDMKLIMEVEADGETGWMQIDMIVTYSGYKEWAIFRMTPIRNVKGFVLGNLYSSFGEVLEISIQPRGIRAKFAGTEMVAYSKRAGVEEKMLSANVGSFMHDIARFFWLQAEGTRGRDFKPSDSLKNWRGINPNSPTFEDLVDGIKAVADTLEQLGEFGTVLKYKNAKELIAAVKARYIQKMERDAASTKFDKASTPSAIAAADKVKKLIAEYIAKINALM